MCWRMLTQWGICLSTVSAISGNFCARDNISNLLRSGYFIKWEWNQISSENKAGVDCRPSLFRTAHHSCRLCRNCGRPSYCEYEWRAGSGRSAAGCNTGSAASTAIAMLCFQCQCCSQSCQSTAGGWGSAAKLVSLVISRAHPPNVKSAGSLQLSAGHLPSLVFTMECYRKQLVWSPASLVLLQSSPLWATIVVIFK